jgi:hypothetical protein
MRMRELLTGIGATLAIAFVIGTALAGDVSFLSLFGLDSFSHSFTWE